MRITIFEVEEWERKGFSRLQAEHDVQFVAEKLAPDTVKEYGDSDVISTFIYSKLGTETLEQFDSLQLIATRSTGVDHVDLEYCREHKISVANVPEYGTTTVAEHVFALLLTISHRISEAIDRTRRGDFSQAGLQGFDLHGKTLGVIGTGSIGRRVVDIAKGFDMQVAAYDVNPDQEWADRSGVCYADLETVLAGADIVTLHVPANDKTHHLLAEREFALMKEGVVLINTARGEIVDIQALLHALADGKVAAVGLDVLPEEPVIREEAELIRSVFRKSHNLDTLLVDHILLKMRNVVVTPHSAFNTREAVQRIIETTVENIEHFQAGEADNIVNR